MLVLGVDPGTAITGYGLVEDDGDTLSLVACGVVTTPAGMPLPLRLQHMYRALSEIVAAYRPTEAAVEELFFSRNARTALAVGQARGVVLLALADANLSISEYTPLQIKQAITGYGQASKQQVQEMVKLLLNLEATPEPDDAADAVAAAICHIHHRRLGGLVSTGGN